MYLVYFFDFVNFIVGEIFLLACFILNVGQFFYIKKKIHVFTCVHEFTVFRKSTYNNVVQKSFSISNIGAKFFINIFKQCCDLFSTVICSDVF